MSDNNDEESSWNRLTKNEVEYYKEHLSTIHRCFPYDCGLFQYIVKTGAMSDYCSITLIMDKWMY